MSLFSCGSYEWLKSENVTTISNLRDALGECWAENERLKKEAVSVSEKNKLAEESEKFKQENKVLQHALICAVEKNEQLSAEVELLDKKYKRLKEDACDFREQINNELFEQVELEKKIKELCAEIEQLKSELAEANEEIKIVNYEKGSCEHFIGKLKEEIKELKSVKSEKQPHKCPICDGEGCLSCKGSGIVWG